MSIEAQVILWTCNYPIAWSLIEWIDAARYAKNGRTQPEDNDAFDSRMLGIFFIGYWVILS